MAPVNHTLEIYEPYEYDGPNPVSAEGIGLLKGPGGSRYYLVTLAAPLSFQDSLIPQLLIQCRYSEDKIERPTQSMCTVNLSRIRAGLDLDLETPFTYADIMPWGVGKITPCQN